MFLSLKALSMGWKLIDDNLMERISAIKLTGSLHHPLIAIKRPSLTFALYVYRLGLKTNSIRERLARLVIDVARKRAELSEAQIT